MELIKYRRSRQISFAEAWPDLQEKFARNQLRFALRDKTDKAMLHQFEVIERGACELCKGVWCMEGHFHNEYDDDGNSTQQIMEVRLNFELESDLLLFENQFMVTYKLSVM